MSSLARWPVLLAAALAAACAPGGGRTPPTVPLGLGGEKTPLSEIRNDPERFVGKTVATSGRVEDLGTSGGARWIDLADASGGGRATFLIAATAEAGALEGTVGREVELEVSIDGTAVLEDGRRAVRVTPLQILTSIRRFDTPTAIPSELEEQLAKLSESTRNGRATTFRDPDLHPAPDRDVTIRVHHLDPELRKPLFSIPGPAWVERSGTAAAPGYVFRSVARSEDGGTMEVACAFRVEEGALRSTAYEEIMKKPDGAVVSEERLDFLNGEAVDPLSGKSFRWPPNIYAASCLPFALAGFPLGEAAYVDFFLWSDYDPFTAMVAAFDGRETVAVAAGSFDCFRVRMRVNTEKIIRSLELPMPQAYDMARDIAGQLTPPDTIYWYTAAKPHLFIRMQGPLGAPGTTPGIVERTRLSDAERAALRAASGVSSTGN
ncbi:MAG: hypothetical protein ACREQ9_07795 [Candidatus Binatia bacterium]